MKKMLAFALSFLLVLGLFSANGTLYAMEKDPAEVVETATGGDAQDVTEGAVEVVSEDVVEIVAEDDGISDDAVLGDVPEVLSPIDWVGKMIEITQYPVLVEGSFKPGNRVKFYMEIENVLYRDFDHIYAQLRRYNYYQYSDSGYLDFEISDRQGNVFESHYNGELYGYFVDMDTSGPKVGKTYGFYISFTVPNMEAGDYLYFSMDAGCNNAFAYSWYDSDLGELEGLSEFFDLKGCELVPDNWAQISDLDTFLSKERDKVALDFKAVPRTEIKPGETVTFDVTVTNNNASAFEIDGFAAYCYDFQESTHEYWDIDDIDMGNMDGSVVYKLQPGETKELTITVTIPEKGKEVRFEVLWNGQKNGFHYSDEWLYFVRPSDQKDPTEPEKCIKGNYQGPNDGGGILLGIETYNNKEYLYEVQIYDCTLEKWTYSTGRHKVDGNSFWAVWPAEYGYYWTLFRVYDEAGNVLDEEVYGFENTPQVEQTAVIKGLCQMPYEGGGYLIGFETYDNQNYQYEMFILDCTLLNEGKDAWIYTTGRCGVAEGNAFWTVWQPLYGYYWTLFRIYDANGNLLEEQCYGFENI